MNNDAPVTQKDLQIMSLKTENAKLREVPGHTRLKAVWENSDDCSNCKQDRQEIILSVVNSLKGAEPGSYADELSREVVGAVLSRDLEGKHFSAESNAASLQLPDYGRIYVNDWDKGRFTRSAILGKNLAVAEME